ncbi:RluA family pseudouridine synthase [Lacticaseibacillus kribbianus]|uniref:RluA family pseudouridine synthase n=1 Tax=Lacticaseibacillus kribbianus TaxID=2926292 RepID=UPI001CD73ADA|nr:RluA family pseudouridine synthase [Lacticaseibacillus kribbianus]
MNYQFEFTATRETTVRRLLDAHGVSWRLYKKLAAANTVWLGRRQTSVNERVAKAAKVRFELPPSDAVAQTPGDLDIVLELDNWLVVNKPAGLNSVPGPSHPTESLLNRVAAYLASEGIDGPQPAIMTRLDRDTTGLVLVAKHVFAQSLLDESTLTKTYQAVVEGTPEPAQGVIDLPLGKGEDGIHRVVTPAGQEAITDYRVLAAGPQSLVELTLHTGRTHQIRAHLAYIDHPVVGDPLYGHATAQWPHQLLCASTLAITDPFTGERHALSLPLPAGWPVIGA